MEPSSSRRSASSLALDTLRIGRTFTGHLSLSRFDRGRGMNPVISAPCTATEVERSDGPNLRILITDADRIQRGLKIRDRLRLGVRVRLKRPTVHLYAFARGSSLPI